MTVPAAPDAALFAALARVDALLAGALATAAQIEYAGSPGG